MAAGADACGDVHVVENPGVDEAGEAGEIWQIGFGKDQAWRMNGQMWEQPINREYPSQKDSEVTIDLGAISDCVEQEEGEDRKRVEKQINGLKDKRDEAGAFEDGTKAEGTEKLPIPGDPGVLPLSVRFGMKGFERPVREQDQAEAGEVAEDS